MIRILSTLAMALFSFTAIADNVDRGTLTKEQTMKQLGQDLADLHRIVAELRAEDVVLCNDQVAFANNEVLMAEMQRLGNLGYSLQDAPPQKRTMTYVGVGLELAMDTKGVIAVGALPGSSAAATGMFGQLGYRVMAVNGNLTAGKNVADVAAEIRGGRAGAGVVVTFKRESRDGTFDRYLERKPIVRTYEVPCIRMISPPKTFSCKMFWRTC